MSQNGKRKSHSQASEAEVLALAEGLVMALGKTYDAEDMRTLRGVAESYPDQGRDGSAEVVASLIGLLDDLMAREQLDREALQVHVHAWRFMVANRPGDAARGQLLDGLRRVRDLYEDKAA